jgi:hypothetical protein
LDGTQYHSSKKIHCDCCSTRTHKNGTVNYFHSAISPVIVAPGKSEVIALAPEFITPQDGAEKQDCEINAAKLNLLAFLFHTVLQMVDTAYQKIRQQRGTRQGFFQDILSLTKYLLFEGWQALIDFMLADSPPKQRANSS